MEKMIADHGFDDVEWITDYKIDDQIIDKVVAMTNTHMVPGYISLSLKHYEAFFRMARDNIREAIIFEDDVILSDFWDISKIPRQFPYVKLGKGVPDMNVQLGNTPMIVGNNGGSEAYYVKCMFARDFIENVDLGWTIDIEQHAYLFHNNIPLICVPMCSQEFNTTVQGEKKYSMTWEEYVNVYYKTSQKFSFTQLTHL
jgi:hypothetical protein